MISLTISNDDAALEALEFSAIVGRNIYDDVETLQNEVTELKNEVAMMKDQMANAESDTGWQALTLNDGWHSNDYATEKPMIRKVGKVVMLRGLVSGAASAGNIIAAVPDGFIPSGTTFNRYPCTLNQTGTVNIQINKNGINDYTKTTSTTRTYICLNSIIYFAEQLEKTDKKNVCSICKSWLIISLEKERRL